MSVNRRLMEKPEFDIVRKARHYNVHASGIECIEVVRHLPFDLGNAVKYIWRCGEKGNHQQDIEKALYYLEDQRSLILDYDLIVSPERHVLVTDLARRFADAEPDENVGLAVVELVAASGVTWVDRRAHIGVARTAVQRIGADSE